MQPTIGILFLLGLTMDAAAQDAVPTNSFAALYKRQLPTLHYQYDSANQVHNYSGNWDLDKDGKTDGIYFVGTGGAHLYFYLRVRLSSNGGTQDFPFIASDLPLLPAGYVLNQTAYKPIPNQTYFAVYKDSRRNQLTIFVRLPPPVSADTKTALQKRGLTTNFVTLSFKKGQPVFSYSK